MLVLENAQNNTPTVNRHLAKMLNRLHDQLCAMDLLHRVHVLNALHCGVLQRDIGWRRVNEQLVVMAKHVCKAFLSRLRTEPWLIVTALMGISSGRITTGTTGKDGIEKQTEKILLVDDLTGDRQVDLEAMVRAAVDKEFSHTLNWLIKTMSTQLNLLLADSLFPQDAQLVCDSDGKKTALVELAQLLEFINYTRNSDGKWSLRMDVDRDQFEQDLQVIIKSKAAAELPIPSVKTDVASNTESESDSKSESESESAESGSESDTEITPSMHFDVAGMKRKWEEMRASHPFLRQPAALPMVIDSDDE